MIRSRPIAKRAAASLAAAVLAGVLAAAPATAEDGPGGGARDLDVEDSAILPSAEGHEASRAPTMEIDCVADPGACVGDPILTPTEGPALSEPPGPEAAPGATEAGEPVAVEPTAETGARAAPDGPAAD